MTTNKYSFILPPPQSDKLSRIKKKGKDTQNSTPKKKNFTDEV